MSSRKCTPEHQQQQHRLDSGNRLMGGAAVNSPPQFANGNTTIPTPSSTPHSSRSSDTISSTTLPRFSIDQLHQHYKDAVLSSTVNNYSSPPSSIFLRSQPCNTPTTNNNNHTNYAAAIAAAAFAFAAAATSKSASSSAKNGDADVENRPWPFRKEVSSSFPLHVY